MKFPLGVAYEWYRRMLRHPRYRLWVILGSLLYLVSPLDLAPDLVPIVGQIDDFAILTILFTEVTGLAIEAMRSRQDKAVQETEPGKQTVDVDAVAVD